MRMTLRICANLYANDGADEYLMFMNLKFFKETKEFFWTKHALAKMRFYGISENRVKKIFRKPDRTEEGIASGTTAAMQRVGSKRKTEIWVMWQGRKGGQKKIITAWRYPGTSPVRSVPVPQDILKELTS